MGAKLTNNLKYAIGLHFTNISGLEPPPSILLEEVLVGLAGQLVVALGDTIAANEHLALGMRLVGDPIVALLPVDQSNIADG